MGIEKREWESITPTEQLMEVEEEPSNNAPSPSAPNPRRNKRKRSETAAAPKRLKPQMVQVGSVWGTVSNFFGLSKQ